MAGRSVVTNQRAGAHAGRTAAAEPLSTKLQRPAIRQRRVARPRLLAQLSVEPLPRVTLVDAPAGWGKTTLVTDWIAVNPERRFAWLALDREDNDPARFWTYVVDALRTVEPTLGHAALTSLRVPGAPVIDVVLPGLINELGRLSAPVSLVLDDYHLIGHREIHQGMQFLVEHLPPTFRIVLITRSDPMLPLPRLRARGELTEVRADELRFNDEETAELLNDVLELDLDADEVARLQGRTEGWAVGLHLAALSLRGRPDAREFIKAFAGDDRHVVDYLGAEVLASLADDLRTFLLRTSILDRISAPLCDAVAGVDHSARLIADVERSNLFLVPLDATRTWYRYHHLFAELLRHELDQTEPEAIPGLHRRAAAWLTDHGDVSQAIRHATLAGDFGVAADLIALNWSSFLQRGQLESVAGWLDDLPDSIVAADPRLCLTRAWIAVNAGRIDEIDQWIRAAEGAARLDTSADSSSLEAAAAMLRCIHEYLEGDVGGAIAAARAARELEPNERSPWRSVGCPVLGIALFWRGDNAESASTLEQAVRRARSAANHLAVIHAHSCLAVQQAELGSWEAADQLARTAIDIGREQGLEAHWANAMAHVARGRVLEHRGDLDNAVDELRLAVDLSEQGVAKAEVGYALLAYAEVKHRCGRPEEGREAVREARRAIESCRDPGVIAELLARTERRLRVLPAPQHEPDAELTDRELAVLRLLPGTLSLREIGSTMFVSLNTVKTHARSIYRKLGVSSRAEAVATARERRLI